MASNLLSFQPWTPDSPEINEEHQTLLDERVASLGRSTYGLCLFALTLWVPAGGLKGTFCNRKKFHVPHISLPMSAEDNALPLQQAYLDPELAMRLADRMRTGAVHCCPGSDPDGCPALILDSGISGTDTNSLLNQHNTDSVLWLHESIGPVERLMASAIGALPGKPRPIVHPLSRAAASFLSNFSRMTVLYGTRVRAERMISPKDVLTWSGTVADFLTYEGANL